MRQRSISYCLILILQLCLKCLGVVREFSVEEQRVGLTREFSRCLALQESTTSGPLNNSEIICPADFDGLSCWTATPANQTAYRQCPDYLNLFDSEGRIVAAHISHIHLI
ncbi:hypothetical protein EB796_008262 [Bugula neritina]|uniref:G-protein coupled receptors family 2 profile 1 domain-containing protein n=1 Tax=Bugula neritina TaxID=10212 RepID=A0A7J7K472_BUGNE|nr:hypothetical protein EB796_008262 [Bugula neritina]